MDSRIIEKLPAMLDELKAQLENLKDGILFEEQPERTLARIDYILSLVKGE